MSRCFRGLQGLQLICITPLGRSARAKPRENPVTETSNLGCTLVDWTRDMTAIHHQPGQPVLRPSGPFLSALLFGNETRDCIRK